MPYAGVVNKWLIAPRQRVSLNEPLRLLSFAASPSTSGTWRPESPGIARMEYRVTPIGGTFRDSAAPTTVNVFQQSPITTERYFFSAYEHVITKDDFDADISFTVEPFAIKEGGGGRSAGIYTFFANPLGTRQKRRAWIDINNGSDTAGVIDDITKPFKTLAGARTKMLDAISDDNNFGGCEFIYLSSTSPYPTASLAFPSAGEWVCFKGQAGGESNTTLRRGSGAISGPYTNFMNLRLESIAHGGELVASGGSIWVSHCDIKNAAQFSSDINGGTPIVSYRSSPISGSLTGYWQDNSRWYNGRFGSPAGTRDLIISSELDHLGEDVAQQMKCLVGCNIHNLDGGPDDYEVNAHVDVVQWFSSLGENALYAYNNGFDLHYQCDFVRQGTADAFDVAFINNVRELRAPIRDYGAGNSGGQTAFLGRFVGLMLWHNTYIMLSDTENGTKKRVISIRGDNLEANVFKQEQASIVGCYFEGFHSSSSTWSAIGNVLGNRFSHNHFGFPAGFTPQSNAGPYTTPDSIGGTNTTGQTYVHASVTRPVLDIDPASSRHLRPSTVNSPVVRASFVPMIAWDITGRLRSTTGATVGAYEFDQIQLGVGVEGETLTPDHRKAAREYILSLRGK